MPTSTFYNLSEDKKHKVIDAVKYEFTNRKIKDMSVKNIVDKARIARGSFYQYFTSKEDLINYILKEEYNREIDNIKELLVKNKGDIFEAAYEYLLQGLTLSKEETKYTINITEYLKDYAIHEIKKINVNVIREYIDLEKLNINSPDELAGALTIIIALISIARLAILSNLVTYEEGINNYKVEIELLKKGLLK